MLDKVINILNRNMEINDWKIVQTITEASELFLIKKKIEMPRSKCIANIAVTVYKDFEKNGRQYRGSSTVKIHPTMSEQEIEACIQNAAFASSFIKNESYTLPHSKSNDNCTISSRFDAQPLSHWIPKIKEALYKHDNFSNGYINSSEIFLDKNYITIVNSRGINSSFTSYNGHIELITSWKEDGEEIELYRELMYSDYDPDALSETTKEMLELSRDKASTKPTPNLENFTVILRGEPVAEVLKYYYSQSDAQSVYQQISTAKPGESIQGNDISGDRITMTLEPFLNNSVVSAPVDEDGIVLNAHKIIDNGILKKYWGANQYSQYLGVEPTGKICNYVFEGGSKSIEEMRAVPHLEIAAFSDFTIDTTTSDFAGEIRLGWYYDGNTRVTVSGGSISGNLKNLQTDMYLSKELQQCTAKEFINKLCFKGPKAVMLHNVSVAGN